MKARKRHRGDFIAGSDRASELGRLGGLTRGDCKRRCRLSDQQRVQIAAAYRNGERPVEIAAKFGVSRSYPLWLAKKTGAIAR